MEKTNEEWQKLLDFAREKTYYADRCAEKEAESPMSYAMPQIVVEQEVAAWKALSGIPEHLLTGEKDRRIYYHFFPLTNK